MFSALRDRFGIPGLISVIALVFAMGGGAFAAQNSLTGSGAEVSAKKSQRGARGPKGAQGAQGAPGAQGPIGPAGPAGAKGADGAPGLNGNPGQGVVSAALPVGDPNCPIGGSEFTVGSATTYACNGKIGEDGEPGEEGSPWTAGGTLPGGETETGTWGFVAGKKLNLPFQGEFALGVAPISFTIPLATNLDNAHVEVKPGGYDGTGTPEDNCPGKAEEPKAKAGFLCVYTLGEQAQPSLFLANASATGAALVFHAEVEGQTTFGTWAVTAE